MTSRTISLCVASVILAYSAVILAFDAWFPADLAVEQALCRFGICANDLVVATAYERLTQGSEHDVAAALPLLEEALRRNPHSPIAWLDLASANATAGRDEQARSCLQSAVRQGPNDARVRLRAGNIHLRLGDRQLAFRHLSGVLALVRDYDSVVFHSYERAGVTPMEILAAGIPDDAGASRSFLDFLLRRPTKANELEAVGEELRRRSLMDDESTLRLAEELLSRGRPLEARKFFCGRSDRPCAQNQTNLVFDSDFHGSWSSGAFGWSAKPGAGFSVSRVQSPESNDGAVLSIRFDSTEKVAFDHVWQTVVVNRPGWHTLRARIRSESLSSGQGLAFQLLDVDDPGRLAVQSEAVRGDSDWRMIDLRFKVPPGCQALDLRLVQPSPERFRRRARGSIQVDWVTIRRDEEAFSFQAWNYAGAPARTRLCSWTE